MPPHEFRRLSAPLLAMGGSFIVALIIGFATAGSSSPGSPPTAPSPNGSATAGVEAVTVTVMASPAPASPVTQPDCNLHPHHTGCKGRKVPHARPTIADQLLGSQVTVLDADSLRLITWGRLNAEGFLHRKVAPGAYLICLQVPSGWLSALPRTSTLPGWICTATTVASGPAKVPFKLITPAPTTHTTRRGNGLASPLRGGLDDE